MDPSLSEFTIIFVIATTFMVLLAIAIVTFVVFYQKRILQEKVKQQAIEVDYQQRMIQATLNSQEEERKRLAGDLHDSIGAMLSTIKLGLASLVKQEGIAPSAIQPTKEMLDETINSVRSISRDLMPSTLEKFGLSRALEELCSSELVEDRQKHLNLFVLYDKRLLSSYMKHSTIFTTHSFDHCDAKIWNTNNIFFINKSV